MPTRRIIVSGRKVSDSTPRVMTSPDAITWTEVPSWPGGTANAVNVTGNAYFVATGAAGASDNYAYSFDGDNWTLDDSPPIMNAVAWTGTEFVNVQTSAAYASTLASGAWSSVGSTGTSNTLRKLIYQGGLLVGVGVGGGSGQPPIIWSSDSGATWSTYTPTNNLGVYDVAFGNAVFVAVRPRFSGASDAVITSSTGTSWSLVSTTFNDHAWYNVSFGNGIFVAVGLNNPGATRTMTSTDGSSWTLNTPSGLMTSGLAGTSRMTFWAGLFVLTNTGDGNIYTSADGVSWTATAFSDREWFSVAAGAALPRGRRGVGAYVR